MAVNEAKNKLLTEIEAIVMKLQPDISDAVKLSIKEDLAKFIESGIEAEKKTATRAIREIESSAIHVISQLEKELKQAIEEIQSGERGAVSAIAEALDDWIKAAGIDGKLAQGISVLPGIADKIEDVINAAKVVKDSRHDITVDANKLLASIISLIVSIVMLLVLLMV